MAHGPVGRAVAGGQFGQFESHGPGLSVRPGGKAEFAFGPGAEAGLVEQPRAFDAAGRGGVGIEVGLARPLGEGDAGEERLDGFGRLKPLRLQPLQNGPRDKRVVVVRIAAGQEAVPGQLSRAVAGLFRQPAEVENRGSGLLRGGIELQVLPQELGGAGVAMTIGPPGSTPMTHRSLGSIGKRLGAGREDGLLPRVVLDEEQVGGAGQSAQTPQRTGRGSGQGRQSGVQTVDAIQPALTQGDGIEALGLDLAGLRAQRRQGRQRRTRVDGVAGIVGCRGGAHVREVAAGAWEIDGNGGVLLTRRRHVARVADLVHAFKTQRHGRFRVSGAERGAQALERRRGVLRFGRARVTAVDELIIQSGIARRTGRFQGVRADHGGFRKRQGTLIGAGQQGKRFTRLIVFEIGAGADDSRPGGQRRGRLERGHLLGCRRRFGVAMRLELGLSEEKGRVVAHSRHGGAGLRQGPNRLRQMAFLERPGAFGEQTQSRARRRCRRGWRGQRRAKPKDRDNPGPAAMDRHSPASAPAPRGSNRSWSGWTGSRSGTARAPARSPSEAPRKDCGCRGLP